MDASSKLTLKIFDSVDLEPLIEYHCGKFSIERARALDAAEELKKWLLLSAMYPDASFPMLDGDVDDIWHSAILYSPIYWSLCRCTGADYIHHVPCVEGSDESRFARPVPEKVDFIDRYGQFVDAYEKEFGPLGDQNLYWRRYIRKGSENCTSCTTSTPIRRGVCGIRG